MSQTVHPAGLLTEHLDRFARALRRLDKGDPRALHRARVASRRLREMIPALPLDTNVAHKLNRRLRKITTRLGAVRELDVLLLLIDELHESRRPHSDALARVAVAVSRERDRARDDRRDRLSTGDLQRTARKLRAIGEDLERTGVRETKATRWAVDARVTRRAGRLGDALREASTVYLPERLHSVRIAVKKLRYSLELANALKGGRADASTRALRRAQDALGRMHDLQVLIDRVRRVQATLTPPSVTMWRALDALVLALEDDCRRLHGRFMRVRPELDAIVKTHTAEPGTRNSEPRTRRAV